MQSHEGKGADVSTCSARVSRPGRIQDRAHSQKIRTNTETPTLTVAWDTAKFTPGSAEGKDVRRPLWPSAAT